MSASALLAGHGVGLVRTVHRIAPSVARTGSRGDPQVRSSRIAAKRRQARAERRARAHAEETSELMDVINHELRTPLTAVIGYTEMLLCGDAGGLTPEQAQMLRRVETGADQLRTLVEALLHTASAELAVGGRAEVGDVVRRVLADGAGSRTTS